MERWRDAASRPLVRVAALIVTIALAAIAVAHQRSPTTAVHHQRSVAPSVQVRGDSKAAAESPTISTASGATSTLPDLVGSAVTTTTSPATTVAVTVPPPPWAASVAITSAGLVSTDVGCARGTDAGSLNNFLAERIGPLMGADYQHVVALGGNRYAWFFQDAFIDPAGAATRLDDSHFVHNLLLVQTGTCFTMLHRGSAENPQSFERGIGGRPQSGWFWPMGAETVGNRVRMFWAEMVRDPYEPAVGDGVGWHPVQMWLATYDAATLRRLSFQPAPNSGVAPLYGYAVASDGSYTYLFGNTFEQNLVREGGYWSGPHSATAMYLARVPVGRLDSTPEYRTADAWSTDPADARPFLRRFWVENPMQPRYLDGQWVSVAKVDGYWGEQMVVDVANQPWGPWTTVTHGPISPRGNDPSMNTYHLHLLPWRAGNGALIVTVSQNAREMRVDALSHPERYRLAVFTTAWAVPPPDPTTTTTTSTTTTSTTSTTTTSTTTTSPPDTSPPDTVPATPSP